MSLPDYPSIMTVIGAGAYGTALAITLARQGYSVVLWGHHPQHIEKLAKDRCNLEFLPDVSFPETLRLESNLENAVSLSRNLLVVVASHVFGNVLRQLRPYLRKDTRLVWATKGLEAGTGRLLQKVAREILPDSLPLAVISGPTFAKELAFGLPTAITLACSDPEFSADLHQLLHCEKSFRVYRTSDLIGVQIGGAVKNVIAIGAGISDGMKFGANARSALITRGLAEMTRLGVALGADHYTFIGMAGLGDLVLTCTDDQSRNRRFGMMIGQGIPVEEAKNKIGQVIEGYGNTKEVFTLAQRHQIEMPITEQIYQVLYCQKNSQTAALSLLNRSKKNENSLYYGESEKELEKIWSHITLEAKKMADGEPALASFFHATILKHENLGSAIVYILASKLSSDSSMPAIVLSNIFEKAYCSDKTMILAAARDILAVCSRDPAVDKYSTPLLYLKGFQALQAYRISHWLWCQGRSELAIYLQNQISIVFGVDIHPAATIGFGIMLDHATGIVIGETTVIENDVSILQSVTLGGTGKTCGDRHPKIREGVMIGAGAKVLGNIEVGVGAKIGAGSVVLEAVPAHTTVAGVPARIVGKPQTEKPSFDMDQNFNFFIKSLSK